MNRTFKATAVLVFALISFHAPAFATCTTAGGCPKTPGPTGGTCLQDEYTVQTGSTKSLGCTAGDVKIAQAQNPRGLDGSSLTQCIQGSTFSFIADFFVVTTSSSSRSNIGLYLNTKDEAGGALAKGDSCVDNIISPVHAPGSNTTPPTAGTCFTSAGETPQCLGSANWSELDPQTNPKGQPTPDNCGDGSAGSTQTVTIEVDNVKCEPGAGGQLVLPNCTSWQIPGGTIQCESGPDSADLTGWLYSTAAVPGNTSKCSCNSTFTVPIQVITAGLGVSKTASPTAIPSGTDGGTSNYTVTVTNQNNAGSDTVEQICDNVYGNIYTSASFTGSACPAGTACTAPNNIAGATCATSIVCPATGSLILASPNDSMTCTFTGAVPENQTGTMWTDTVTATAVAQNGGTVTGTASATVTSGDATASAAVIKTLDSANPTQGCATVVYDVEVDNTSGSTTDEDETLTGLSDDKYGVITSTHGNAGTDRSVVSTTCATGATIYANSKNGPTKYTCSFNGVMCGPLGSLTNPPSPTSCAAGLELTDTITATLTGDESGEAVSSTPGSRTVDVCFSATSN